MMVSNEDKVLGSLLSSNATELTEMIGAIKKEYFQNAFNKEVYGFIQVLFNRGEIPDVVTVSSCFKEKGNFNAKTALRVSKMPMHAPRLPHEVDSSLKQLHADYNKTLVGNFLSTQTRKFADDNMTPHGFIQDMKSVESSIQHDDKSKKSNQDVLEQVLIDHDKAANGDMPGITIGHSVLEDIVMLEPVDVMVIGARPAMGKTAFAISTIKNMTFAENKKIAFFCIEMSEVQLMRRLMACIASIDSKKIRKGKCTEAQKSTMKSIAKMKEFKSFNFYTGDHSVEDIAAICSSLKNSEGLDLIVIDYIQKVTSSLPASSSDTEKVKQVCNDLKRVTQRLEVPQIQFAQLNKNSSKEGKRPTLPDLKQTGDIEQDASIVAFLHRPEYYGQPTMPGDSDTRSSKGMCEFIVAKNREDGLGIKDFNFEPWYSRFSNYSGNSNSAPSSSKGGKSDKHQDEMPF